MLWMAMPERWGSSTDLHHGDVGSGFRIWEKLPREYSSKEFACQGRRGKRLGFNPWVEKIHWSRKWQPAPVFLPGESHEHRSLTHYSPWGHKESYTTEWQSANVHTHTHTHTHCPVGGSGSNHVLFAWLKSGLNGGLHLKMLRCQNFPGMLWRIASMLGRIIRCTSNFHPWCTHLWGKTCEYGRMSLLGLDSVFLKGGMCQIQLRLLISWLWVHQNGGDPEQAWSGLFRGESNYSWDSLSLYTMKKSRYRTGRV